MSCILNQFARLPIHVDMVFANEHVKNVTRSKAYYKSFKSISLLIKYINVYIYVYENFDRVD